MKQLLAVLALGMMLVGSSRSLRAEDAHQVAPQLQQQETPPAAPPAAPQSPPEAPQSPTAPAPQTTPTPTPQPPPQPTAPPVNPAEQRKQFLAIVGAISPMDAYRQAVPRQTSEPCLARVVEHHPEFDLQQLPLTEWLDARETTGVPWKVQVLKPQLRMDQRSEVAYSVRIRGKDLKPAGARQFVFVSGISSVDGRWLVPPKVGIQSLPDGFKAGFELTFGNCVFVQPGEYVLWMIVYDGQTAMHSVAKRRVRIAEIKADPLPQLGTRLPAAEFPELRGPDRNSPQTTVGRLFLPVAGKRPLRVQLVPIVSPPEQWTGRSDIVGIHNSDVLTAVGMLSQMELEDGSISIKGLDLVKREIGFEQNDVQQLNWQDLANSFTKIADGYTVSLPALQGIKDHGAFFRESLIQDLENSGDSRDPLRVIILVSSSLLFERGSVLQPLKIEGDCGCRVYHLRFRFSKDDIFDDLEKLIKPLRPLTFNVMSPLDMRKAVAEIVADLERL